MVERVLFAPGGATEAKQDNIIIELQDESVSAKRLDTSSSGTNVVHTPAAGKRIRLFWVGLSGNPSNGAPVKVGIRFTTGGTDFLEVWLSQYGGAFAHFYKGGESFVLGGVDEPLVANLSAAQNVLVNIDYEEV